MSDQAASGSWRHSTRIISRTIEVEGVVFCWWAVGSNPALVNVKSPIFGADAEFTTKSEEALAYQLAESLLRRHFPKGGTPRVSSRKTSKA